MSERNEDSTFRERVLAHPEPAMIWLAGAFLLFLPQASAFFETLILWGDMVNPFTTGSLEIMSWYVDTMYSTGGTVGGTILTAIGAFVAIAVVTVLIKAFFIPFSIVESLGVEDWPISTDLLERVIVGSIVAVAGLLLVFSPLGSALQSLFAIVADVGTVFADRWTLLSREVIPNQGFAPPSGATDQYSTGPLGPYHGTFLGLEPAVAWAIRVVLVYVYAFVWIAWAWFGYKTFRRHYRYADWTPRDDMIDRFSTHRWGQFGFVVVAMFLVMAIFAPPLGPVTAQENIHEPYSYSVNYTEDGEVLNITHGSANSGSTSQGGDRNVGILQYDDFGRFHPIGTTTGGKDLWTFMTMGSRVSLFIGLLSVVGSGFIGAALALVTAYYKGLTDLIVVVTSDGIQAMPALLVLILLGTVLADHPISNVYNGALVFVLIFVAIGWAGMWRALRGPALQVSEQEWIDAARSYGQRPTTTMKKHMAPYILGYLLVYGSLRLGGIIISVAALSFLGLGIEPPVPEWGRMVNSGQPYVSGPSWHIATVPGLMVVLVVTGFNAFGDGIRDAIDPQSEGASGDEAAAAGGGG
ncbi:ABC transporter permease [Halorubellus sp. JP-L1]|uniref:ABC transporter permease n=1 Tax=Halorubellus sp. JP-L1 TaxID=2715753 RepID=UPI00140CCB81|nr:ABC transporter permease [Halorubellus sp. JP-L1]NHN41715.1 ABC transporter permease [Halorubellus sp. JP-L1]